MNKFESNFDECGFLLQPTTKTAERSITMMGLIRWAALAALVLTSFLAACPSFESISQSTARLEGTEFEVCHIPPGHPAGTHTIRVDRVALSAHLAHGDAVGPCPLPSICVDDNDPAALAAVGAVPPTDNLTVTLCHIPLDDPFAAQTLNVPASVADEYIYNGAVLGTCELDRQGGLCSERIETPGGTSGPDAGASDGGVSPPETAPGPVTCLENYRDLHTGEVPATCVRLSAYELGRNAPVMAGGLTVSLEGWTASAPGDYTGFSYTASGDVLVSGATALLEVTDDGDGAWLHPDGTSSSDPLLSVAICRCTVGDLSSPQDTCGNGILQDAEACDDGNAQDGDGCAADCSVEPGWQCEGAVCEATACGDGIVAGFEECEDGGNPPVSGDGCTDRCRLEAGWHCPTPGAPCVTATCGNGVREGLEACDDGNFVATDGCNAFCEIAPNCLGGACAPSCGDGLVFTGEACDDGNLRSGDGCSSTCSLENGFSCATADLSEAGDLELPVIYRDFIGKDRTGGHPDFQRGGPFRHAKGLVLKELSPEGVPQYNPSGSGDIVSADSFSAWYQDSSYSETLPARLRIPEVSPGVYELDSKVFFPLDGPCPARSIYEPCGLVGQGREETRRASDGVQRNFHFTTAVRHFFEFRGGEDLRFRGDDDVWVFINGRLAVDVGGVHGAVSQGVVLDTGTATDLGLQEGQLYEIAVFHAERHTVQSNFRLTMTGFSRKITKCSALCGDGIVTPGELCDDGINDGRYGSCSATCKELAPHCGDGVVDPAFEECDDGNMVDGDSCSSECKGRQPSCPFLDWSMCEPSSDCGTDFSSIACASSMETYCGEHPTDPACQFQECNTGQSFVRCLAIIEFCESNPTAAPCNP